MPYAVWPVSQSREDLESQFVRECHGLKRGSLGASADTLLGGAMMSRKRATAAPASSWSRP